MFTPRNIAIILAVTLVVGACGYLLSSQLKLEPVEAAVVGAFVGLPMGLGLATGVRRWLLVMGINVVLVVAYLDDGWSAAFYAVLTSALAFGFSAISLKELYEGSRLAALKHHVHVAFCWSNGFQVIEGGKTTVPAKAKLLLGPRKLLIKPDNAAILERGKAQTKVLGPAFYGTAAYEHVREIFDLRVQNEPLIFDRVVTDDGMEAKVRVQVTYGIDIPEEMRMGKDPFETTQEQVIRRIDMHTREWNSSTRTAIENAVRRAVGAWQMGDLFRPAALGSLGEEIARIARATCRGWHVRIDDVIVAEIAPSSTFTGARIEADAELVKEVARANALRQTLILIAQGYKAAKDLDMEADEIHREVLRRTLMEMRKDPAVKLVFTPELQELLSSLGA